MPRNKGVTDEPKRTAVCTIRGMSDRAYLRAVDECWDNRAVQENTITDRFLENPNEHTFAALFNILSAQLLSFFRRRTPRLGVAEDLTQDVMLTVYEKSGQLRDRNLFRAWVFKVAQNALYQHCGKWAPAVPPSILMKPRIGRALAFRVSTRYRVSSFDVG